MPNASATTVAAAENGLNNWPSVQHVHTCCTEGLVFSAFSATDVAKSFGQFYGLVLVEFGWKNVIVGRSWSKNLPCWPILVVFGRKTAHLGRLWSKNRPCWPIFGCKNVIVGQCWSINLPCWPILVVFGQKIVHVSTFEAEKTTMKVVNGKMEEMKEKNITKLQVITILTSLPY